MKFTLTTVIALATAASASASMRAPKALRGEDGEITCDESTVTSMKVERESIVEGQEYLDTLGVACKAEVGHCSRLSCSNDAAIWICNNMGVDMDYVDCSVVRDYTDHIFDQCQVDGQYSYHAAQGTMENTDGWNVQVGWNAC